MIHEPGEQLNGPIDNADQLRELGNQNFDLLCELARGDLPSGSVDLTFDPILDAVKHGRLGVSDALKATEEVMTDIKQRIGGEDVIVTEGDRGRFVTYWAGKIVGGPDIFFTETIMRYPGPEKPVFTAQASLTIPTPYSKKLEEQAGHSMPAPRIVSIVKAPETETTTTDPGAKKSDRSRFRLLGRGLTKLQVVPDDKRQTQHTW